MAEEKTSKIGEVVLNNKKKIKRIFKKNKLCFKLGYRYFFCL